MSDFDDIELTSASDSESYDDEQEFEYEQKPKQSWVVDQKVHSIRELQQIQVEEEGHVSNILGCSIETAATLLRFKKWNKERLIEGAPRTDIRLDAGPRRRFKCCRGCYI